MSLRNVNVLNVLEELHKVEGRSVAEVSNTQEETTLLNNVAVVPFVLVDQATPTSTPTTTPTLPLMTPTAPPSPTPTLQLPVQLPETGEERPNSQHVPQEARLALQSQSKAGGCSGTTS